jgi:hypothetical protein
VIPVIMGATGTFSKSFKKYLMNKPEREEILELQSFWAMYVYT